jgi:cellulose synthase/poly-beta-1,6-N-acetylglucosamine synthase-like glycosyltransferase
MQLTLVMPCYNRARDLQRVLEAYDRQETDAPFEILAVDDASTDDTYLGFVQLSAAAVFAAGGAHGRRTVVKVELATGWSLLSMHR